MKTADEIRSYLESWLAVPPDLGPPMHREHMAGRLYAFADVLEDHELKRRVAEWFRRAEEAR